jgi:hypothetical protein
MEGVSILICNLNDVLDEARQCINNDLNSFCNKKIFALGKFIGIYSEILKKLQVNVNEDIRDAFKYLDPSMVCYDQLMNILSEWDQFVRIIDQKANEELKPENFYFDRITVNDLLPHNVLINGEYFRTVNCSNQNSTINMIDAMSIDSQFDVKYIIFVMLRHFA